MENIKEEKDERKSKKDLIIKIILVIIIILLLLHNCVMMKKSKNEERKTPTGNVDIFEIKCEQDVCIIPESSNNDNIIPNDDNGNNNSSNSGKNNNNSNNTVPNNDNNEPASEDDNEITIVDKNIVWSSENKLRIFENSAFEYDEIIAPESSNVYQFIVKNTTKYDLKYKIDFIEDNVFNINMRYKLKKNDKYVIDEYVSASELKLLEYQLNSGASDTYYLEWKWVSSSNDTAIGNNPSSNYKLSIEINAESL